MSLSSSQAWPAPNFNPDKQPHFLFIINPSYCGSTVLAKVLETSKHIMLLQKKSGEGQWLIPGLSKQGRWNADMEINEESIKAVWLSEYQMQKDTQPLIDIVVEKSPPNMVRIHRLMSLFKNHSLLAYNRNPYAFCSSSLHRVKNPKSLSKEQRHHVLKIHIENWINRSMIIKNLINEFMIPWLTYEEFCASPETLIEKLIFCDEIKETINIDEKVYVKNYPAAKIQNYNDIQIAKLSDHEINMITKLLMPYQSLLKHFNYSLL